MNFRLLVCVTIGVLMAFFAVVHIIDVSRNMSQPPASPGPDMRFTTTVIRYQDEQGRDVERESQYSVPTELAGPELLKRLPPVPGETAQKANP